MAVFATISYIPKGPAFIALAFITRFLQGLASAQIQTTCYSLTTILYQDRQAAIIGYIECAIGVGVTLGPIFGAVLYGLGGFTCPFYTFGAIFILFGIFIRKFVFLPPELEQLDQQKRERGVLDN